MMITKEGLMFPVIKGWCVQLSLFCNPGKPPLVPNISCLFSSIVFETISGNILTCIIYLIYKYERDYRR